MGWQKNKIQNKVHTSQEGDSNVSKSCLPTVSEHQKKLKHIVEYISFITHIGQLITLP